MQMVGQKHVRHIVPDNSLNSAMKSLRIPNRSSSEMATPKDKVRAFAELESRGHDVRGNPPAQIKQILKRRPSKQKSKD
jgi:hypothetical protein